MPEIIRGPRPDVKSLPGARRRPVHVQAELVLDPAPVRLPLLPAQAPAEPECWHYASPASLDAWRRDARDRAAGRRLPRGAR